MKLTAAFLAIGTALALPQSFYFSFPSREGPPLDDYPAEFRRSPWNAERGDLRSRPRNTWWFSEPDDDLTFGDDESIQSRNRFGIGLGFGGFQNPFTSQSQLPVVTLYEFTATVLTTVIQTTETTCIPSTAFFLDPNAGTHIITPCPILLIRKGIPAETPPEEQISPSITQQVVPTAGQDLLTSMETTQHSTIDSSMDETEISGRSRRFFYRPPNYPIQSPSTITSVVKTNYVSTLFSLAHQTVSLTNLGFTNVVCLPPGLFVCPVTNP